MPSLAAHGAEFPHLIRKDQDRMSHKDRTG